MKSPDIMIENIIKTKNSYKLEIGKDGTWIELPKACFERKKPPRVGDTLRMEQKRVEGRLVSSIFINNEQIQL